MRKNKKGFTMAEVLITLSIIGIMAAILFPSILANYNERTLKAKRQALFGRMSQAMGQMADTFRNYASVENRSVTASDEEGYTPNCSIKLTDCADNGSALKFITEGLSQYYKIAAICDADTMNACDVPSTVTMANGEDYILKNAKSWTSYFPQLTIARSDADNFAYDLKSAAFMTKNGESILLWYNPNCSSKSMPEGTSMRQRMYTSQVICVNMVYDLNGGKNKPNKVGEDIGFISVFYNDAPVVVAPKTYDWNAVPDVEVTRDGTGLAFKNSVFKRNYYEAKSACAALGDNVRLPSLEEGMSMQFNQALWAPMSEFVGPRYSYGLMWTNTWVDKNLVWQVEFHDYMKVFNVEGPIQSHSPAYGISPNTVEDTITRCVYDN